MRGDQLNLRTAQDAKEQARELALIAQLEQEMENPFHRLGHLFTATAFKVYWEHLYISGILCLWTVWWGAYPAFARFRHRHLCRYRKKQVIFRRWFFSTQNIPKWRVDHENQYPIRFYSEEHHLTMTEHENAETMHAFWSTQPVSQTANEVVTAAGPRETKTLEDVPKEPYAVASTFEWWTPNILDDADLEQLYQLLCDNYVEDDDSMFRFKYSKEFLRWALTPPGYVPDWLVAVRRKKDHQMLAFIAGIPLSVRMGTPQQLIKDAGEAETDSDPHFLKPRRICEINFLCIHKKLRAKRMAPLLIREITRRVNLHGIWQAIYTAGVVVPTPFATAQYYHRSLNPEKLVATHFSSMPPSFEKFPSPMAMLKRVYSVAQKPQCRGWRDMRAGDVPAVAELLKQSLAKYDVAPCFNEEEVRHMLLPREGVVYSYVIEDSKTSEVTDFASFYSLPSTVIGNSKYSQLNAAYVLYYAANTVPIEKLITDTLIMAVANNFDVMNMVDILQNSAFTKELRFGIGDGKLHYYLYNWFYPKTEPSQVALVML